MNPTSSAAELAKIIDHTLLRPEATRRDIDRLCEEALQYRFHAVCVHGSRVGQAFHRLGDQGVKVCTVVGFPLGAMDADAKRYETEVALDNGAAEIDVVLNIGLLKDRDLRALVRELRDIVEAADERIVKVIIETGLLTEEEKILACQVVTEGEAAFVKTCTGLGPGGATVEDVRLLRRSLPESVKVKASGGIRSLEAVRQLIEAGAERLGTSAGAALVSALQQA